MTGNDYGSDVEFVVLVIGVCLLGVTLLVVLEFILEWRDK